MDDIFKPTDVHSRLFDPAAFDQSHILRHIAESPAEKTYHRLCEYIRKFEATLDQEHEIGAKLVTFGQAVVITVSDIGYWGPDIITFHGFDAKGNRVQLIQNYTQLSVLLVPLEKTGQKANRIGFKFGKKG